MQHQQGALLKEEWVKVTKKRMAGHATLILVRVSKHKNKSGAIANKVSFRIGKEILQMLKWDLNSKVVVYANPHQTGLYQLVNRPDDLDAYTLSGSKKSHAACFDMSNQPIHNGWPMNESFSVFYHIKNGSLILNLNQRGS